MNDVTGLQIATKTNEEGIYVLLNLPPGPYRLQLFDKDSHTEHQILCRDVPNEEQKSRSYDGR